MIKYVAFVGILAISLRSIITAFQFAEVEPFKTAITMKFLREWPFVLYAGILLFAGLFIERFLLPLPLSARRSAGYPGAHAHVRVAQALPRMRRRMSCLCANLHRSGDLSARADQSQRVHLLPEMPGKLLRPRCLPASEETCGAASAVWACACAWRFKRAIERSRRCDLTVQHGESSGYVRLLRSGLPALLMIRRHCCECIPLPLPG